jgi:hypothetical protein
MSESGRNDPCPCGSGLKYKKCCLPKHETARAEALPRVTPREMVMPKLMRFAYSPRFDRDHDVGHVLFWADYLDEMDPDETDRFIESDDSDVKYNAWFLWDLIIDDGRTVADLFLERHGRSLEPGERAYVERMRGSHLSLYQVDRLERGRGVLLRDLLTKSTMFVYEKLGSEQLIRSDLVGARVVPNEAGLPMFEGGLYLYDVADKSALVADLKRYRRNYRRRFPDTDDVGFLKRHGMVFNYWWLDRVVLRPAPTLATPEGDQIMLARSTFDVADPAALRAALAAAPDVQIEEDGEYTFGEDTGAFRRILGTLILDGNRLRVETMSRHRDERCRAWLTSFAPGVTFRATSLETIEKALERARSGPPPPEAPDGLPPDLKAQIERQMLDEYYYRWLDEPIPALGHVTPREAAASRKRRPLLIDLLREFDNRHDRAVRDGRPVYDTSWLWQVLKLRRDPLPAAPPDERPSRRLF